MIAYTYVNFQKEYNMSLVLIYLVFGLITMAVVFFMLTRSPEAFEDEQGFHYGTPDNKLYAVPNSEKISTGKSAAKLRSVYGVN